PAGRAPTAPAARAPTAPAAPAPPAPAAPAPTAPDTAAAPVAPAEGPYDLEPLALTSAPLLDGYVDDWPRDPAAWKFFSKDEKHRFGILSGVYEHMLYVLLDVHDEHPVF